MRKWTILLSILVVFGLVVNSVFAVPSLMNYQGRLTDASGNPITTSKSMTFSIYGTATGGSAVWTETQTVTPDSNGIYNLLLGSITPLTSAVFDGSDRYLQVTISGEALLPRMRLVSVGYAITADNLGGGAVNVSSSGNVGIGTTGPTERLDVVGNIKASGTVTQGSSRELKKDISYVSTQQAMDTLKGLSPVRFRYKADDSGEKHLGFIAEEVPDLVATQDRKHLSPMDLVAVLTKVVQEQQRVLKEQQDILKTQQETIFRLSAKVKALEDKI